MITEYIICFPLRYIFVVKGGKMDKLYRYLSRFVHFV